jgi:uncharacterized protein
VKYVVLYTSAEGVAERAPAHFEAHRAHWRRFLDSGELLEIGAFGDPQAQGSMAIFNSREAAEQFAKEDPFVLNGVVSSWELREWNEVLEP